MARRESHDRQVPKFSSFNPRRRTRIEPDVRSTYDESSQRSRRRGGDQADRHHIHEPLTVGNHGVSRNPARRAHCLHRRPHQYCENGLIIEDIRKKCRTIRCSPPPSEQSQNESADFFVIDTRGDPDNFKYGGISKWNVPKYHLGGGGAVLGLDPLVKIDWAASTREFYVLKRLTTQRSRAVFEALVNEDDGDLVCIQNEDQRAPDQKATHEPEIAQWDAVVQDFREMGYMSEMPSLPVVTSKG